MPVSFTILGSGSGGNCAYVESKSARLLIDAGLSLRQIRQRLATIGRTPENLTGILVTHEHSDHIQALTLLTQKLRIPVICNRFTCEAIQEQLGCRFESRLFNTGASFEIDDMLVESFSVPHDAQDPVGFMIHTSAGRIGFLTDLGHATKLVIERVRHSSALVLESNHDVKMLQDCPHRPWSLKQRILSRHGHLSNEAAADVAQEIASAELRHLFLGHLSSECNRPDLALEVVGGRLRRIGATHVSLQVASQNVRCPTLTLQEHSEEPAEAAAIPAASGEPSVRPEGLLAP